MVALKKIAEYIKSSISPWLTSSFKAKTLSTKAKKHRFRTKALIM